MSPTARTLAWLRDQGFRAGVVERHNTFSGKKTDLFGCIDIVAVRRSTRQRVGVQACSAGDMAKRETKIRTEARAGAADWIGSDCELWVVGWRKYATRIDGKHWRPRVVAVLLKDVEAPIAASDSA